MIYVVKKLKKYGKQVSCKISLLYIFAKAKKLPKIIPRKFLK